MIYRQRERVEEQHPPPAPGLVFWDPLGDVVLRRKDGEVLLRNSEGRVVMGLFSRRSRSASELEIWELAMVWGFVGLVVGGVLLGAWCGGDGW
jgi:hypothetical protein